MESLSTKEQLLKYGMTEEQIDTHESDLYVLKNATSERWVSEYAFKSNVETFVSQLDGKVWYDIPFGYSNEYLRERIETK